MIKDSGERTEFSSGAVRDMHVGKGRFDLLPWYAIHEVAKHCEDGALKYGERNVDKGIPLHSLLDSAIRHLVKYMHGETDEPHLRAAAWNVLWALEQETTHPEMNDLPTSKPVKAIPLSKIFEAVEHIFGVKPEIKDGADHVCDMDTCEKCRYRERDSNETPCVVCCHCYPNKYEKAVNDE